MLLNQCAFWPESALIQKHPYLLILSEQTSEKQRLPKNPQNIKCLRTATTINSIFWSSAIKTLVPSTYDRLESLARDSNRSYVLGTKAFTALDQKTKPTITAARRHSMSHKSSNNRCFSETYSESTKKHKCF